MHEDLLFQARHLATLDARKPKQINLRRAVSSAYYALFHFLVEEVCRSQLGTLNSDVAFRNVIARAFAHSTMKRACLSFSGGTLPNKVASRLPGGFAISGPIRDIASAFVDAQQERHEADYDRGERFNRTDVLALVEEIEGAIAIFQNTPASVVRTFFLCCLWAWDGMTQH